MLFQETIKKKSTPLRPFGLMKMSFRRIMFPRNFFTNIMQTVFDITQNIISIGLFIPKIHLLGEDKNLSAPRLIIGDFIRR